ncbi:DNA cytosine methyltransferase [Spirosoma sordidisoli]|uniref:Cytosine-specific methyltransferase n=1 Tax=Spirosoma sordidisoli TaxID=2502893 RepID=A0A4Q2UST8_9BACT|nr:DNA cytosine methyltransferase [Spirosoma sordidisoli]
MPALSYATVCSGIEAPSVAWHPLGWRPVWFSEIDRFASQVLSHHYPDIPNLGDMTLIHEKEAFIQSDIDLLFGGTPCQSFSIAGLRKGLSDPRGNLALTFLAHLERKHPWWFVWENVPGVLSSWSDETAGPEDGTYWQTNDFDTFLCGLREIGYGVAWRIFDAQYFGLAQRRERVFVVGCLGDERSAQAVLFESGCLQGYPAPSRKKGQSITYDLAPSLKASGPGTSRVGDKRGQDPVVAVCMAKGQANAEITSEHSPALTCNHEAPIVVYGIDEECNVSENHFGSLLRGGQEGTRQAVAYRTAGDGGIYESGDHTAALTTNTDRSANIILGFRYGASQQDTLHHENGIMSTLPSGSNNKAGHYTKTVQGLSVRRLMPVEAERLQGFPDGYTDIKPKGKPTPDGPRYKVLGNSIAVPVLRWIGRRIQLVHKLKGYERRTEH